MSGKKTIRFISPVRWDSYDFSPDELYLTGNTGIWDGDRDDEPEENWRTGNDFQEDDDE